MPRVKAWCSSRQQLQLFCSFCPTLKPPSSSLPVAQDTFCWFVESDAPWSISCVCARTCRATRASTSGVCTTSLCGFSSTATKAGLEDLADSRRERNTQQQRLRTAALTLSGFTFPQALAQFTSANRFTAKSSQKSWPHRYGRGTLALPQVFKCHPLCLALLSLCASALSCCLSYALSARLE